jgi:hypothetical protein
MRNAFRVLPIGSLLLGVAAFAACSGGGATGTSSLRIKCIDGQAFCLVSCDLSCSQTGCAATEIAENQTLRFKFSDRVDPASVNGASVSIRTASGAAPDGDLLVVDNVVSFEPRVSTSGGISTFGFQRNETYIISLAGGATASQGVRSFSGDGLTQQFTCTVRASLGIQDSDQQPPTVTLIAPTSLVNVPQEPTIVLRFSELIDTTPLQSPLSASSPIRMVLRPTLPTGECDLDAAGTTLEGLPTLGSQIVNGRPVTEVSWRPPVQLPGLSCLTVYISADLRDLSGRAAIPAEYELLIEAGTSLPITIVETFNTPANQEELVSGGLWNNGATPGLVGSDGRHGSFSPAIGASQGQGVYIWSTQSQFIPGTNTPSGQAFTVLDGKFYFTDFVLDDGVTLKFTGPVPPEIFVRGRCEIRGTIDVSAVDMPHTIPTTGLLAGLRQSTFNARGAPVSVIVPGQPGGIGGVGGANGGAGGLDCAGTGPTGTLNNGQPGQDVKVAGTHAYVGSTTGTGGRGSDMNPPSGLTANAGAPFITGTSATITYRDEFSRGGSGGGYMLAGGVPGLPTIPASTLQPTPGPVPAPGAAFPLLPYPSVPPVGYSSLLHYLVGGSGGGGGGCHTFSILSIVTTDVFMAGHGGSGGGGAVAVRVGGDLTVFPTGKLLARGGRGVVINGDNPTNTINDLDYGCSSPGGGGSGGSVLLQSSRTITVSGLIDTSGGEGSRNFGVTVSTAPTQLNVQHQAGAGSNGFYRLEARTGVVWNGLGATVPAYNAGVNAGTLTDRDGVSGDLSKWRATGQVFPPTWLRYELDVDLDGNGSIDITYTDRGEPGDVKANDPMGPVIITFQGATMNQSGTAPIAGTIKQWREGIGTGAGPGIQQDGVTGFRFALRYNVADFPNQVLRQLRVYART